MNILLTETPDGSTPISFSGDILYCIRICGYSELISKETIHLWRKLSCFL